MNKDFLRALALCLICAPAFAADPQPQPLWSGSAQGSLAITSGNSDTRSIGVGGELNYKPEGWTGLARFLFTQNYVSGVESAKQFDAALRGARKIIADLDGFVQFGYFRNPFAGINDRYSPEAGVTYSILSTGPHLLHVDAGGGYVVENRLPSGSKNFPSAKVGAGYKWKISETAELFDDAVFTEDLKDTSDWRFTNNIGVAVAMTSILSLKVSYGVQYLNQPVPGFQKTDTITSAALVAKF